MRPIWTGALSFGLVNIPVRVYSAVEEKELDFTMLHKEDLSPIRYARICKADGKEIPYKDIVKGYEYQKGEYVVVDEIDFKKANAKKTQTIEILNFTFIDEIDPLYFEKPYFEPEKSSGKAYAILREALAKSKKVAVVNFVFRNKEHIGVLIAQEDVLILNQLRFSTVVRSTESLNLPSTQKSNAKEIEMALKLMDQLTEPFQPHKYEDTYTHELLTLIDAKLKGKKPSIKGKAPQRTQTSDIMKLLKESLHTSLKAEKVPKARSVHKRLPAPKQTTRSRASKK